MPKRNQQQGFALLLSLIISSVVLAIGMAILDISINQINLSATARESELAFQSAHAGVDCLWYWRNEHASSYIAASGGAPSIECFGTTVAGEAPVTLPESTDGYARLFSYEFEWGDPARCTGVDMYVMNAAGTDNLTLQFENDAIGTNGLKTCKSGNVCTILVSGGYNRACDEITSSIFSVQREITVEF
jgi:hypothetical protein